MLILFIFWVDISYGGFLGALYLDRDDLSLPNFLCDGLPVVREGEYDLGEGTLYISAATMGLKILIRCCGKAP